MSATTTPVAGATVRVASTHLIDASDPWAEVVSVYDEGRSVWLRWADGTENGFPVHCLETVINPQDAANPMRATLAQAVRTVVADSRENAYLTDAMPVFCIENALATLHPDNLSGDEQADAPYRVVLTADAERLNAAIALVTLVEELNAEWGRDMDLDEGLDRVNEVGRSGFANGPEIQQAVATWFDAPLQVRSDVVSLLVF